MNKKLEKVCPNCNEEVSNWDINVKRKYCDVCGKVSLTINN